jgi:hypothetical protein
VVTRREVACCGGEVRGCLLWWRGARLPVVAGKREIACCGGEVRGCLLWWRGREVILWEADGEGGALGRGGWVLRLGDGAALVEPRV